MKKYHVYGIGNALLDLDFEVSESTLERLKIDKGVMTLIDEDRHHYLLTELDGVKHLKACGGSVANTLFTLQQMGAEAFCSCKIGDDESGDFFYRDLIVQGVHTNLHECRREGVTGKCIVLVTPDADRTMNTFLGATANFSLDQLSEPAIKNSEYLYIEGYLVAQPTGCEAAIEARKIANANNIKVAISLSDPNMVRYFKDGLCAIIGDRVDILFCNEDEAMLFTKTDSLLEAREALKEYAHTFVITLGANGSLVYNGIEFSHALSYQAEVLDTLGAGDVFAGVFLYAITHGYGYFAAADFANFAASKVVAKYGPRLTNEEIGEVRAMLSDQLKYA